MYTNQAGCCAAVVSVLKQNTLILSQKLYSKSLNWLLTILMALYELKLLGCSHELLDVSITSQAPPLRERQA